MKNEESTNVQWLDWFGVPCMDYIKDSPRFICLNDTYKSERYQLTRGKLILYCGDEVYTFESPGENPVIHGTTFSSV